MSNQKLKNTHSGSNSMPLDMRNFVKQSPSHFPPNNFPPDHFPPFDMNTDLLQSLQQPTSNLPTNLPPTLPHNLPSILPITSPHVVTHSHLGSDISNPKQNDKEDGEFMKFFHVDRIINPKYGKNMTKIPTTNTQPPKQFSSEQLSEMMLLFKLTHDHEFFRYLNVSEYGRKIIRQIDLCLETMKNFVDISPDHCHVLLNDLITKHKEAQVLSDPPQEL